MKTGHNAACDYQIAASARNTMHIELDRPRRVGLLFQGFEFHHRIFLGVLEYSRIYRNWIIERSLPTLAGIQRFVDQGVDGIIGQITEPAIIEAIHRLRLPAVNISALIDVTTLANVLADDVMIGQLAADHLFSLGLAHYAFVGQDDFGFVNLRKRGFQHGLRELGCGHVYSEFLKAGTPEPASALARLTPLGKWLISLPKPVGVFCSTDLMAFYVHRIARDCGLDLGRSVRLLGVDNQLDYCEAVHPPFSSIEHGMIGFRAAETLERLMNGQPVPSTIFVPPKGVVSRDRNNTAPALPSEVHAVMQLIASRSGEPLHIDELLSSLPLSRRYIEKRFKQATGRSIYQEVQRQRIERASMLLRTTRWPIERVGDAAGFTDPRQFSRVFRQYTNTSPREYRQQHAASNSRHGSEVMN
jgi:LacI family transcriptional regulator